MTTHATGLTQRPAWHALAAHYETIKDVHLRTLFKEDAGRGERLTAEAVGLYLDYSKHRVTDETLRLLLALAEECDPAGHSAAMFRGAKITKTEDRAVQPVAGGAWGCGVSRGGAGGGCGARGGHGVTRRRGEGIEQRGYGGAHEEFFDTIRVYLGKRASGEFLRRAVQRNCNLRPLGQHSVGIALDEATTTEDVETLLGIFRENRIVLPGTTAACRESKIENRKSDFLNQPVFNNNDSENTERRSIR